MNISLYLNANLYYFLDKKLRAQLDNTGINEINDYLKKLLEKILNDNLLSHEPELLFLSDFSL